ncbi:MAG: NADH:ubiquinone reductase (Na(+)-transporting) subunit D [Bacteroidota bacterium]
MAEVDVLEQEVVEQKPAVKPKEPLFSKKNRKLLSDPFNDNNPITVQVLGICSALAITVKLQPAIVMALSVVFVMAAGNVIISILRNFVPNRIRIIVQLVIVAALVVLVDQVLKAFVYDVSKELAVFVGLIITNCIIMGRLEAFALGNTVWRSFLDGIGNAVGYGVILVLVAFFRELLGSGQLLGAQVIPESWYLANGGFYSNNGFMLLPPMALITVGIIIWIQRARNTKLIEE